MRANAQDFDDPENDRWQGSREEANSTVSARTFGITYVRPGPPVAHAAKSTSQHFQTQVGLYALWCLPKQISSF